MSDLFIPVILGTGRADRQSEHVANYVHQQLAATGVRTELIDVRDYLTDVTVPTWEDHPMQKAWAAKAAEMDGMILIVPEYNHGYPGELKILLDKAFDEYRHKPVGICAVSSGGLGGARAAEAILPFLVKIGLVPSPLTVYFSRVKELFDDSGTITDEGYNDRIATLLDDVQWYGNALKTAREQ